MSIRTEVRTTGLARNGLAALVAFGLCVAGTAHGQSNAERELAALVKAAKAEGELFFYSAPTEAAAKRLADGFEAKYGVKANFTRLAGGTLFQRYASEAESGNIAADMALVSGTGSPGFGEDGIKKGWVESVQQARLPVVLSGEFPKANLRGPVALIQISVWGIIYNSDKAKGSDVPKDFRDILNPRFRNQLLLSDPRAADAYVEFYGLMLDKYGEGWFNQLRALNPRFFLGGVPAMNALAAGEGVILPPGLPAMVDPLKRKGAPVELITPEFTTGAEQFVLVSARGKSKRPNAGRLFANYVMSREGNKILNDEPGGFSIYDTSALPKQYQSPSVAALARKDQIARLLGLQ